MRKNQYEEALFRCEDDRFDLDMHIETNASAKAALQPINAQLMHMDAEDRANFRIEDTPLRAIHYTSIKRIYGTLSSLTDMKLCLLLNCDLADDMGALQALWICRA